MPTPDSRRSLRQAAYPQLPEAPTTPTPRPGTRPRSSKDFHDLALRHASARRVVCPDYRGRGRSAYDPDWRNYLPAGDPPRRSFGAADGGRARSRGRRRHLGGRHPGHGVGRRPPGRARRVVLNDIGPEIGEEGEARILRDSARDLRPLDWAEGARLLRDTWGAAYPLWDAHRWAPDLHRGRRGRPASRLRSQRRAGRYGRRVDYRRKPASGSARWPTFRRLPSAARYRISSAPRCSTKWRS